MKTLILTLAAAASLTAGGAAMAQPYGYDGPRWGDGRGEIDRRIDILQRRIDDGVGSGDLNRREAYRAKAAMRDISLTERTYIRDGRLTGYERADLNRRLDLLARQIRFDRHDDDRRYGYNTYRPY